MSSFELQLPKRVSYIIATKDRAAFLDKAMLNIRKLKKSGDEVLVVDGLSSDRTSEIIRLHGDLIDVFISEKDTSETHAWNKGILLSRGKYIKVLSDDDVIHPEGMEQAVQVMDLNPEIGVLLCGGTKQQGEKIWPVYVPPGVNYGTRIEDVFTHAACGVGLLIRRSVFAYVQLLNTHTIANDMEFLCRCISQGIDVRFCRINMYHHPIEEHSTTTKRLQQWKRDVTLIKSQYGYKRMKKVKPRTWPKVMRGMWGQKPTNSPKGSTDGTSQPGASKLKPVWDGGFS